MCPTCTPTTGTSSSVRPERGPHLPREIGVNVNISSASWRIERLHASRELYAALIARAKDLDPADCTDPDRCQTIAATAVHEHHAEHIPHPPAWQPDSHAHGPPGTS